MKMKLFKNIIVVLQLVIQSNTEKRIAEKILDAHFSVKNNFKIIKTKTGGKTMTLKRIREGSRAR